MIKKICFYFFVSLFSFDVFAQTVSAKISPEDWLMNKGKELVKILSEEQTKARYVKMRRIAKDVFNQQEMSRLAMGRYWRDFSADQQSAFQYLFFDYFVVTYGTSSLGLDKVDIKIADKKASGKDILISTHITVDFAGAGAQNIPVKKQQDGVSSSGEERNYFEIFFALRPTETGYYIRDAKVEGQSVLMFLRNQLEKEFQTAGYDPNELIGSMREKINLRYRAAEDMAKAEEEKNEE